MLSSYFYYKTGCQVLLVKKYDEDLGDGGIAASPTITQAAVGHPRFRYGKRKRIFEKGRPPAFSARGELFRGRWPLQRGSTARVSLSER